MKIYDFAMAVPKSLTSMFFKGIRNNIDDISKEEVVKNGLYHITPNEGIADKILESQYLKPSKGILNTYGKDCVFLFNGAPDVDNYMKNLADMKTERNPYINPTMQINAIKISPKDKQELDNYKVRNLSDDVILYEGYCMLQKDEVEKVKLVPDLIRDEENGEPLINKETQRYDIAFREMEKDYEPKEDFLKFVEEERIRLGYKKKEGILSKLFNAMNAYVHESKIEMEMIKRKIKDIFNKRASKEETLLLESPKKDKRAKFLEEIKVNEKEDKEYYNNKEVQEQTIVKNQEEMER